MHPISILANEKPESATIPVSIDSDNSMLFPTHTLVDGIMRRTCELQDRHSKNFTVAKQEGSPFCPLSNPEKNDNSLLRIGDEDVLAKPIRKSSFRSILSDSGASSKISDSNLISLIESAINRIMVDGGNDSKLAQIFLATENDSIRTEDALVAAVSDVLTVQKKLSDAEREVKDLSERNTNLVIENGDLQNALSRAQAELDELRKANEDLTAQKQKMAANMRKKREVLTEVESKLNAATEAIDAYQKEKGTMLQGIQKLSAARDDLKTKLMYKNEISREQRVQVERLERRLRATQTARAKELQLLQLYRQLSLHTGYFKWGKQIRIIESELAATSSEENGDCSPMAC